MRLRTFTHRETYHVTHHYVATSPATRLSIDKHNGYRTYSKGSVEASHFLFASSPFLLTKKEQYIRHHLLH